MWREILILKALLYSISSDNQLTGVTALKSIVHKVHKESELCYKFLCLFQSKVFSQLEENDCLNANLDVTQVDQVQLEN